MVAYRYFRLSLAIFYLMTLPVKGQFDPVAFTLGQDTHLEVPVANGITVPFTVSITNHGAKLNSGVFTCTKDGLYKFQIYGLTKSDTKLFLELYHNDKLVASLWGHTPGDYAAAGNAVILPLLSGDFVKVMTRTQYSVSMYGTPNQIYTTFTGVELGSLELSPWGSTLPAFSVSLKQHRDVQTGNPVLYDFVLTDVNGAYDVSTGVYLVPSNGLYLFHFFSLARKNQTLYQHLYHNNQYVCSIYGKTDQDWADAGNTVLLHLKQNDRITIRAAKDNSLYGAVDQIYSTFTGTQLVTETEMSQEPIVAFSVGLSHHATIADHSRVVFDRIFINLNHVYDQSLGEFTAPVAGLYEFNYHALGQKNGKIWLELFRNYRYVNSLYSHTPEHYASAGNAAVIEMDAGDIVFVRAHGSVDLYGKIDQIYCTFTGYLLRVTGSDEILG